MATLDATYGAPHCAAVSLMLPNTLASGIDAWVAERVRPWIERHDHTTTYRRDDVAIYFVHACSPSTYIDTVWATYVVR